MLIPVPDLIKKFNIQINGVLHLGAHQAEEAGEYQKAGATKVIWIEGNPELIPVLETELKKYPNHKVYNVLVSDKEGEEVSFNVTNNFQSSSILDLGTHKSHFPGVKVHHVLKLKTNRLDNYFSKNNIDLNGINFLNIDLQGAELLAIKGLGEKLKQFNYIYTEVNVGSVYVGCATLYELDKYMHTQGFYRTALSLTKWQWGDALYERKEVSSVQKNLNLLADISYQVYYNTLSLFTRTKQTFKNIFYKLRRVASKIKHGNRVADTNYQVDPAKNGELLLMSKIISSHSNKFVAFDVGANMGLYTNLLLKELENQKFSDYELHLFEPQKKCYDHLKELYRENNKIKVNHFALSDVNGVAFINADFSGSSSASLFERKEIELGNKEEINLKKLGDYIKENKIEKVDLLKIDTEGNEKKVILGGAEEVNPNKIKTIQFEYGGTYLDAGITLAEVVQLLLNKNYYVGKLTGNGIEYKPDLGDFIEDYAYSNYIASNVKL